VKNLARQGFKAKEIAEQLNVSVDAIYHSDGWKNRNL
jgi:DNA-binding NarL/FixJ family response regulator